MRQRTTFGKRLTVLRGKLNQADFAKRHAVAKNTFANYERGDREPAWKFLQNLAKSGVNVNWLLTGDGPMMLSDLKKAGEGALDLELLENVIQYAEEVLNERRQILTPPQKAVLFKRLYKDIQEREGSVDFKELDDFLKMAGSGKVKAEHEL